MESKVISGHQVTNNSLKQMHMLIFELFRRKSGNYIPNHRAVCYSTTTQVYGFPLFSYLRSQPTSLDLKLVRRSSTTHYSGAAGEDHCRLSFAMVRKRIISRDLPSPRPNDAGNFSNIASAR